MSYIGNQPSNTAFLIDTFSGNNSTVSFTMSIAPAGSNSLFVIVSGVVQSPLTYSVVGTTLTFSQAPPAGTNNIVCRYLALPASNATTTAYRNYSEFTATAGQTTFTPSAYTPGFVDVYRNGVKLAASSFTATNGTTVVLSNAAVVSDNIVIISFYVSSVLNAIPATAGSINSTFMGTGAVTESAIGAGAVTYSKLSLTPSTSTTYSGNVTMSGGSNWFDTSNDYFGCEIQPATKLVNGATYYQTQGRLPATLSQYPSNPMVWVLIVSHPTGSPTPGNTITIVSGWKFMLPNGTNGDVFTFDFDNALESFGSAKIPTTGNYYIGWVHTTLTGRGALTGAYWVDTTEGGAGTTYGQGGTGGTVYYQGNPGPVHPRTITPGTGPVAKGMHWRFYQKPDYDIKGVNTLQADAIRSNFSIRVDNKLAGVYELVNHTAWRSSTSAVYVPFQPQLYSHYKLFWNINHGPSWFQTYFRFTNSVNAPITGANYACSGYWCGATDTALTVNSSYFGAAADHIWLSGNGNSWESAGEAVIYTGDDYINGLGLNRTATTGNRFPTVRGKSNLYGNGASPWNYMEEYGGTYWGSTQCAGFVIYGSGGASSLGDVWVYGARYE